MDLETHEYFHGTLITQFPYKTSEGKYEGKKSTDCTVHILREMNSESKIEGQKVGKVYTSFLFISTYSVLEYAAISFLTTFF